MKWNIFPAAARHICLCAAWAVGGAKHSGVYVCVWAWKPVVGAGKNTCRWESRPHLFLEPKKKKTCLTKRDAASRLQAAGTNVLWCQQLKMTQNGPRWRHFLYSALIIKEDVVHRLPEAETHPAQSGLNWLLQEATVPRLAEIFSPHSGSSFLRTVARRCRATSRSVKSASAAAAAATCQPRRRPRQCQTRPPRTPSQEAVVGVSAVTELLSICRAGERRQATVTYF